MNIKRISLKIFLFFASISVVFAFWLAGTYFSFSITPSLNYRFFFLSWNPVPVKDSYIIFLMNVDEKEHLKGQFLTKRVGCIQGEFLIVKDRNYFCNGQYLGIAKEKSLKGTPLDNFKFNGPIPKGNVFVVGDSVDSYDSRYWGFIKETDIKSRAYPII